MIRKKDAFFTVLIAFLPLLGGFRSFEDAVLCGALTAVSLWISALFFKLADPLFPEKFRELAAILWTGVLSQILRSFFPLPLLWGVSLFLLLPSENAKRLSWPSFTKRIVRQGLGFCALVLYAALLQNVIGYDFKINFFSHPEGCLFALFLAAFFWKNQPETRKAGRES